MRKKFYIFVVVLMVAVLLPLSATYLNDTSFTIKAYKSNPDQAGTPETTTLLSVYDALTGNLDEVGTGAGKASHLNVLPYLDKFMTTGNTIDEPKDQVLFSYLVTGSQVGNYQLTIALNPFTGPCTVIDNVWTCPPKAEQVELKTYYQTRDINFIFPALHADHDKNQSIKIQGSKPGTSATVAPTTFTVKWAVTAKKKLTDSWIAEGVIMMALDKASYDNATTGGYRAEVVVTLSTY